MGARDHPADGHYIALGGRTAPMRRKVDAKRSKIKLPDIAGRLLKNRRPAFCDLKLHRIYILGVYSKRQAKLLSRLCPAVFFIQNRFAADEWAPLPF